MQGIITLLILYFLITFVFRRIKRMNMQTSQTQEEAEATRRPPVKPPAAKPKADIRFPSRPAKPAAAPRPAFQEGRDPNAVLRTYSPIKPSSELKSQFSDYKGSLSGTSSEGAGYQTEIYEVTSEAYSEDVGTPVRILPENLTRDALVQAVVMSEILKRPGVRR